MGVIGGHNSKRYFDALVTEFLLIGEDVVAVVMHESFSGEKLEGDGNFNTRVSEPFTETTSNKDKSCVVELFKPDGFVMFDNIGFIETEVNTVGFANVVVLVRID